MKFMTLGATYYSNIWITFLGDKIDGPLDNSYCKSGIKNMSCLFNGKFEDTFNKSSFTVEKNEFLLLLNFCDYLYRPETYSKLTFFLELEERFDNLKKELKEKNPETYFVYSPTPEDEELSKDEIIKFKNSLPEFIKNHLIIIKEKDNSKFNDLFPTFLLKNQRKVDYYEDDRPIVLKQWEDFVKEQTEKGFFPKKEVKEISEILD